jgi:hypothetical protein
MGYSEGLAHHHNCFLVLQSFLGYNHICRGLHGCESIAAKKFPEKNFAVKGCTWIIGYSIGL